MLGKIKPSKRKEADLLKIQTQIPGDADKGKSIKVIT